MSVLDKFLEKFFRGLTYIFLFTYFMIVSIVCLVKNKFNRVKAWECIEREFEFWELTTRD